MSTMKPDGYAVQMDTGNFVGIWREKDIAESVCSKQPASHHDTVEPMYTLATVRKWLEPTDEMVTAGVNALKADGWGLDTEELTESMRFVCRAMLAAKLREIENDT